MRVVARLLLPFVALNRSGDDLAAAVNDSLFMATT